MKKTIAMMALAMMIATPAFADHTPEHRAEKAKAKADYYFNQIDTDKDGKVSKSEHEAFGEKMFSDADTNKDGSISKDEMIAAKKAEMAKTKAAMDAMKHNEMKK